MIDALRQQLTDALADGEWHTWRELAELAGRNLGREMLLAGELQAMTAEGLVLNRAATHEFRLPPSSSA